MQGVGTDGGDGGDGDVAEWCLSVVPGIREVRKASGGSMRERLDTFHSSSNNQEQREVETHHAPLALESPKWLALAFTQRWHCVASPE